MGIDYGLRLMKSQKEAEERFAQWEPKDRADADRKWKEMQDTPDHLTLLQMYKREGIEPIKLAKYVSYMPLKSMLSWLQRTGHPATRRQKGPP